MHKACALGPLLNVELNQLEFEGWELVSVLITRTSECTLNTWHYIFKRKVNESN